MRLPWVSRRRVEEAMRRCQEMERQRDHAVDSLAQLKTSYSALLPQLAQLRAQAQPRCPWCGRYMKRSGVHDCTVKG